MGMDVYGKKPKSQTGEHFRRSHHGWSFLMNAVFNLVDPSITEKCHYWHSCDGDGLDDDNSVALAAALQRHLEPNGDLSKALADLDKLRSEPEPEWNERDLQTLHNAIADIKFLMEEDIPEFIAFLKQSGGFQIC